MGLHEAPALEKLPGQDLHAHSFVTAAERVANAQCGTTDFSRLLLRVAARTSFWRST
jgi:hypothetical protein